MIFNTYIISDFETSKLNILWVQDFGISKFTVFQDPSRLKKKKTLSVPKTRGIDNSHTSSSSKILAGPYFDLWSLRTQIFATVSYLENVQTTKQLIG